MSFIHSREQYVAISTDRFGELQLRLLALWQPHLIRPALVALDPIRTRVSKHPGRRDDGEYVECMAERLAHELQTIEGTNGGQDVAGVGALPTVRLEQADSAEALQHQIEEQPLCSTIDQATTKPTQDRVIESWIVEVQAERLLPIDPSTDGVGGLAVRQIFDKLEHRDQRQAPRTPGWLTSSGK